MPARTGLNWKFVLISACLGVPVSLLAAFAFFKYLFVRLPSAAPPATPPAPTILAPAGPLPPISAVWQEYLQLPGQPPVLAGSGFLMRLNSNAPIMAVTSAHSLGTIPLPPGTLLWFEHSADSQSHLVLNLNAASIGQARTGSDMTVDFALFPLQDVPLSAVILQPDPRGIPQLGERGLLFSGVNSQTYPGTVTLVEPNSVWLLMDDWVKPGLNSGSPIISQYTGKVIGMVIAARMSGNRISLGIHPIGALKAHFP